VYDYGARRYDAATCRFTTMDPLSEKYYSTSPYAYCTNNPIKYIDPTGMIWEDSQEAERLKRNIDNRIISLNKDIAKNQDKLDKGGLSEKQVRKLEGKISEANNRISNLNTSKADIDVLGADQNNVYALSSINGGEHKVRQGIDGKVYIETSSDALSIHEITHVRQSLDAGGLKFSNNGELLNAGVGIRGVSNMEIEAYKMQYSYDKSFPGSLGGRGLQGIDVHSVGGIINDGKHVYPVIFQYSIDLNKFFKQQKKLIVGGK
ncbi:RHS repeat-associated core domain-containing protein, partial [Prevotella sp. OH937_COT-195]|uniref:RHS repeat-associated core domain-containing protein n=1 Tax=Prevotella sp. OH937_COT-195 TaxID=2491051 RepID=UPI000FA30B8B